MIPLDGYYLSIGITVIQLPYIALGTVMLLTAVTIGLQIFAFIHSSDSGEGTVDSVP